MARDWNCSVCNALNPDAVRVCLNCAADRPRRLPHEWRAVSVGRGSQIRCIDCDERIGTDRPCTPRDVNAGIVDDRYMRGEF